MKIEYVCAECGNPLAEGTLTAEEFFRYGEGNQKIEIPLCKICTEAMQATIRCDGGLIIR